MEPFGPLPFDVCSFQVSHRQTEGGYESLEDGRDGFPESCPKISCVFKYPNSFVGWLGRIVEDFRGKVAGCLVVDALSDDPHQHPPQCFQIVLKVKLEGRLVLVGNISRVIPHHWQIFFLGVEIIPVLYLERHKKGSSLVNKGDELP